MLLGAASACLPSPGTAAGPRPAGESIADAELADDLDQHAPKSKLGRGFTDYDEFRQTRVFGWRDVIAVTRDEQTLFYLDFVVVTEARGEPVPAAERVATVRFRWLPEEPGRYTECASVDFLAGGEAVPARQTEAERSSVVAVFSMADLERMAAGKELSGRVCGRDVFRFTDGQVRELRRFWRGLRKELAQLPLPSSAPAAQSEDAARQEASRAFQRGREAFKRGRFEPACRAFRRATVLAPDIFGPWVGLARCAEKLARYATAYEACRRALGLLVYKKSAAARTQESECRALTTRVESRVAVVEVVLSADAAARGFAVIVNGTSSGRRKTIVDPGPANVSVRVGGSVLLSQQLVLAPGETVTLTIPDRAGDASAPK